MRRILFVAAVLVGAGCQGPFGGGWRPGCGPACLPPPSGDGSTCTPCPPPCVCAPPKEGKPEQKYTAPPEKPEQKFGGPAEQPKPVVERQQTTTSAAVAQEVMLVPRTVYVPFVAQTPVTPVRVSGLAAGATTFVTERRDISTEGAAPQPKAADVNEGASQAAAIKDIMEALKSMKGQMDELKAHVPANEGVAPKECGPTLPPYCEPVCPPPPPPNVPGCRILPRIGGPG